MARILIIEDESAHAEAVSRSLEATNGNELRVVRTLKEFRGQVAVWKPDIALMDLNLPDGRAIEVLPDPSISSSFPIVVMTSYGNEQTAVEAMKSGAFDYLVKSPETFRDLPRTLERVLREWQFHTDRKRAEDALRASEERYRRITEGLTDYQYRVRVEHGHAVETVHGLGCEMVTGYTVEDFAADPYLWFNMILAEDRDAAKARVEQILEGQQIAPFEHRIIRKDGSLRWVVDTSILHKDAQGELLSYDGVVKDITERKQVEQEKDKLSERINQLQKLEALGVLVAGVAHNINNVLAAIMATASLREEQAAGAKDQEAYKVITKACKRGRDVVRSLTQFAQPTLSNAGPLDLHSLITEVRILLENTTRNRIEVTEAFCEEAVWIEGDAGSLNHALMNLCLNALDAMPQGGRLIFRTAIPEMDWVEISVEDTGEGMSPEILERVMEPFFTTKPVGQGTGLGLSMTHGVIKVHGGTLEIASVPGQGTTVKFRLPRIPAPATRQESEAPVPSLGNLKVLLVDDDEDVRYLVTRMLKAAGLEVQPVSGGEKALECLRGGAVPDLIILDQNMPGMDGIRTMEKIRSLDPDVPILISSGQPDIEGWPCFQQPNVAVISKPFDMDEIQAKLARFTQS